MKTRSLHVIAAAILLLSPVLYAQTSTPKKPPPPKETFWQWALRFSGISANPNTLKAGNDVESGQVWVADLASGTQRKLTSGTGYRSPVYYADTTAVLALQGDNLMRIAILGNGQEKLYSIPGLTKLIGSSLDDRSEVLVLQHDAHGHVIPAQLSVTTGATAALPYDPQSPRDRQMLEHLLDWQRAYGDTILYVKRESVETLSGTVDVSNVFLKTAGHDPQNVSHCETANCGQPSLSSDGKHVLFIKAPR
jgi:Tol biopolymer transport system component